MDFFKKCFVINLNRRLDRYDEFINRIPFDLSYCQRFTAIDGNNLEYSFKENPYVMGCHLSHKTILQNVINDKTIVDEDFVIIFEDDVFFSKNFMIDIEKIKLSKDVIDLNSIIYIGGRFNESFQPSAIKKWSFLKNNMFLKSKSHDKILPIDYDRTTHVIILSKFACKQIIEKTKNVKLSVPIDYLYNNIRTFIPDMKVYDLFPHICYSPLEYKSDIQNYVCR